MILMHGSNKSVERVFSSTFTREHHIRGTVDGQQNFPFQVPNVSNLHGDPVPQQGAGLPTGYGESALPGCFTRATTRMKRVGFISFTRRFTPRLVNTRSRHKPGHNQRPASCRPACPFPGPAAGRAPPGKPRAAQRPCPTQRGGNGAAPRTAPALEPPRARGDRGAALTRTRRRAARPASTTAAPGRDSGSAIARCQAPDRAAAATRKRSAQRRPPRGAAPPRPCRCPPPAPPSGAGPPAPPPPLLPPLLPPPPAKASGRRVTRRQHIRDGSGAAMATAFK